MIFSTAEKKELLGREPEVKARLLANLRLFPGENVPILIAGDVYTGIWIEHNQDNLFLAEYAPESAWASQDLFIKHQRQDGLIPLMVRLSTGQPSFKQLQMVWPFTRCALEIAKKCRRPQSDFEAIYRCGAAYDEFLGKFRDHAKLGLVDIWCEYDTGHDRSPRSTGMQERNCTDAAIMPDLPALPVQAPDLSAMRFQGRIALAEIADLLGRPAEAAQWRVLAEESRTAIKSELYDPEFDYYFDKGPAGFRRYKTEHLTRLFLNQLLTQTEFDHFYRRYMESPEEFNTPFPFPSISVSDPAFMRNPGRNCWGGNVQALTALRALMWLGYYGKSAERTQLLMRWMEMFLHHPGAFPQELDPFTGEPVGDGCTYTPALLLYLEGCKLLK